MKNIKKFSPWAILVAAGLSVGLSLGIHGGPKVHKPIMRNSPLIVIRVTAGEKPKLVNNPIVGQVLTASASIANRPTLVQYQWRRCDNTGANCGNVGSNTTVATYTVLSADLGSTLRVIVSATNSAGTTTATSPATGVVTSGSTNTIGVTINSRCTGSCTTPVVPATSTGVAITADDGSGKNITQHIYPFIPGNLVTNDAAHKVPLVIVYPDNCTSDTATKSASCFNASIIDNGMNDWITHAAADKVIVVGVFADFTSSSGSGGYYSPTIGGPSGGSTCGASGTGTCNQQDEIIKTIAYMEAHYQIDTNAIFATGGSKGGTESNETLCNPNLEPLFAGIAGGSSGMGSAVGSPSSGDFANPLPPTRQGSCPGMVRAGTFTPISNPHPLLYQNWFSLGDSTYKCSDAAGVDGHTNNGNCLDGGGHQGTAPNFTQYFWAIDQIATKLANPVFSCSNTPSSGHLGVGTTVVDRVYSSCNSNTANGVNVSIVDFTANGCHAFGCSNNGASGVDIADEVWTFWTTGTP